MTDEHFLKLQGIREEIRDMKNELEEVDGVLSAWENNHDSIKISIREISTSNGVDIMHDLFDVADMLETYLGAVANKIKSLEEDFRAM